MTNRQADVWFECPGCGAEIEILQRWTAGGVNDYGGWVLQCRTCSHKFTHHLGRDISDSFVTKGASVIEVRYDDEMVK